MKPWIKFWLKWRHKFELPDFNQAVQWGDRLSKKGALTALGGSFLCASALSLFFSYKLLPDPKAPKPVVRSTATTGSMGRQMGKGKFLTTAEVDEILKRNIFNSEGKLGEGSDGEGKKGSPTAKIIKTDLPLKLLGVIFGGVPTNGMATIENAEKKAINSFMVGDVVVREAKLLEIYPDRIILERDDGQKEYLEKEKVEIVRSARRKGSVPASGGADKTAGGEPGFAKGPPADAFKEEGFERKGTNIVITDTYKRDLLGGENFSKVLQDAKAEPHMVGGALKGFRLTRIRENSIYQKAGFQDGDIVEEINGVPLTDAAGAIKLLRGLEKEKEIEVRVNRGGSSFNSNIVIQ